MAWRSSGTTNDDLINNLKRFGVISALEVEEALRKVDRKHFVPRNFIDIAHADQPLKHGNIHISAPHIYGTVLEALELRKNTALTFLNAGSGTGYLTCIAAAILGPRSSHYCVELRDDVIEHCKASIAAWKEDCPDARMINQIKIFQGNALEIDIEQGECVLGFDRIYIGASISKQALPKFKKLLKPGGILVGPVDDELVKIVRMDSPGDAGSLIAGDFTQRSLSSVLFSPLAAYPNTKTIIPASVWSPSVHQYYPESFRNSCKALLLCSHTNFIQPVKPQPQQKVNAACMLPRVVWMEILSYTHRNWFEAPQSEVEFLRRRLAEEQANSERLNRARLESERRSFVAEKERDVYRLLANRWKSRLNSMTDRGAADSNSGEIEDLEEAAAAMILQGGGGGRVFGITRLLRRLTEGRVAAQSDDEQENREMDDDDDEDEDRMDEDNEEMNEDGGGASMPAQAEEDDSIASSNGDPEDVTSSQLISGTDPGTAKAIAARPQVRTVSISGYDV